MSIVVRFILAAVFAAVTLALTACGGGDSTPSAPAADVTIRMNGDKSALSAGDTQVVLTGTIECKTDERGRCVKPATLGYLTRTDRLGWGILLINNMTVGYFEKVTGTTTWVLKSFDDQPITIERPGVFMVYSTLPLDAQLGARASIAIDAKSLSGGSIAVAGTPGTVLTLVEAATVSSISSAGYAVTSTGSAIGSYRVTCPVNCFMTNLYGYVMSDELKAGQTLDVYVGGLLVVQFVVTDQDVSNGYIQFDTNTLPGKFKSNRIAGGTPVEVSFRGITGTGTLGTYQLQFEDDQGNLIYSKSETYPSCPAAEKSFVDGECQKG